MGFILAPIALFLFGIIGMIHSIVTLLVNLYKRAFLKTVSKKKFQFAFDVDVFGNYLFAETFNALLAKEILFGRFGETISSALGRGRRDGTLNCFGWLVSVLLDIIWITDWLKGGHSKASIMSYKRIEEIKNSYLCM
jgi:hypothetical protein